MVKLPLPKNTLSCNIISLSTRHPRRLNQPIRLNERYIRIPPDPLQKPDILNLGRIANPHFEKLVRLREILSEMGPVVVERVVVVVFEVEVFVELEGYHVAVFDPSFGVHVQQRGKAVDACEVEKIRQGLFGVGDWRWVVGG
jgi:hypothetical protein